MIELARLPLAGRPARRMADEPGPALGPGVLGVDVSPRSVDDVAHTVVQLLLDDDQAGFDQSLLDTPVVADVLAADGTLVARELFDHDRFRRRLRRERDDGGAELRGVLVLTDGELPPPWVRMAFLRVPLDSTAGTELVVARSTADELATAVHDSHAAGLIGESDRATALMTLEQRHPD